MAFTQTTKQVSAIIGKVDGKKLRGDIQAACVAIIGHAMQHGSSPLVDQLSDRLELSPMLRKLAPAATAFLVKHGPFAHTKELGWQFSKAKRKALVEGGYDFDQFCIDAPMWDDVAKAEKKDEAFDMVKELEKLVERAEKRSISGKCIDAALIPDAKALIGQYMGRKAIEAAQASAAAKTFAGEIKAVEAELV
jgi:hypothetical protein